MLWEALSREPVPHEQRLLTRRCPNETSVFLMEYEGIDNGLPLTYGITNSELVRLENAVRPIIFHGKRSSVAIGLRRCAYGQRGAR